MELELRPATDGDRDLLLEWRNDPATREASHKTDPVSAADHARWLAGMLGNSHHKLWIAHAQGNDFGQVRFDSLAPGTYRLSFTIDPASRGEGLSTPLLKAGLAKLWAEEPEARTVIGEAKLGNVASMAAMKGAGFSDLDQMHGEGVAGMTRLTIERPR